MTITTIKIEETRTIYHEIQVKGSVPDHVLDAIGDTMQSAREVDEIYHACEESRLAIVSDGEYIHDSSFEWYDSWESEEEGESE